MSYPIRVTGFGRRKKSRADVQSIADFLLRFLAIFTEMMDPAEMVRVLTTFTGRLRGDPQINGCTGSTKRLHLLFLSNPALEAFTDRKLEGEDGNTIQLVLVDPVTGQRVTEGPGSSVELEVLVLEHFDKEDWTADEFESHVVKPRELRGALLVGELKAHMKDGLCTLGSLMFKDNSSWTRSKTFQLGVRVAGTYDDGLASIREAKSRAIVVKDIRSKGNMKHDVPSPLDEVWRLCHIQKGGVRHRKLESHEIRTVGDLNFWSLTRREDLRKILDKIPMEHFEYVINQASRSVSGDLKYNNEGEPSYSGLDMCNNTEKILDKIPMEHFEDVINQASRSVSGDLKYNNQLVNNEGEPSYSGLDMCNNTEKVQMDGPERNACADGDTFVNEILLENPAAEIESLIEDTDVERLGRSSDQPLGCWYDVFLDAMLALPCNEDGEGAAPGR